MARDSVVEPKPNHRKYVRKNFQLAFETYQERDDFVNMMDNIRHKTGIYRNDILIQMALELLKREVYNENK